MAVIVAPGFNDDRFRFVSVDNFSKTDHHIFQD